MAYPGYGAPGGYPGGGYPGQPGGADPLWGYFSAVAGADQQIDALELQRCLTQSGIAGTYQMFSLETCRIMISMLDRDYSGKMGFNEFKELWTCLNQWRGTFYQYDSDRSGTVEPHELHRAIQSWGYNLSPQALNITVKRYSTDSRISFDNFIAIAVRLRLMTDHFRRRDATQTGHAQFTYDDFIQVSMYC
ncbi:sorcin-like isoform X2 [Rhopilema esculentum]|uniref:sorcin-like isoform X2 n=1 Tax=Rhopilema esculentum TaxID=499914 RepID=UPI0031D81878